MAEYAYPFDGGEGAAITEAQWSDMARSWQDDGVEADGPADTALTVVSQAEPLALQVNPGHAFIAGFHYYLTDVKSIAFAANAANVPRMDRVVLRLDRIANTIGIVVKQGVASSSPVPPSVDAGEDFRELSLAVYTIRANTNVVDPFDVRDAREFIGRRIRISDAPNQFPKGTVVYAPGADRFHVVKNTGPSEIADASDLDYVDGLVNNMQAQLDVHKTSPNAHPNYAQKGHTHPIPTSSPSLNIASGYSINFGDSYCYARAGIFSFSAKLTRTASGSASSGANLGSVLGLQPGRDIYLPAFITNLGGAVSKPGSVRVDLNGNLYLYNTTLAQNEIIVFSGTIIDPRSVATDSEA